MVSVVVNHDFFFFFFYEDNVCVRVCVFTEDHKVMITFGVIEIGMSTICRGLGHPYRGR